VRAPFAIILNGFSFEMTKHDNWSNKAMCPRLAIFPTDRILRYSPRDILNVSDGLYFSIREGNFGNSLSLDTV
jgi:hypothetical protein